MQPLRNKPDYGESPKNKILEEMYEEDKEKFKIRLAKELLIIAKVLNGEYENGKKRLV